MRVCSECGEEKPLNAIYFKPIGKGNFSNKCKMCINARTAERKRRRRLKQKRKCYVCGEWKLGEDFPAGSGRKACFACGGEESKKREVAKPYMSLSDEEIEIRYQNVLRDTRPKGLEIHKLGYEEGDRVEVVSETKTFKGHVYVQTDEFIVVQKSNKIREAFRVVDILIGDYRIRGV